MGEDPNDNDYEAGDDCNACKNIIFDGITPEFVWMQVDGIAKCPGFPVDMPNGLFLLQQSAAPCVWFLSQGGWNFIWSIGAGSAANITLAAPPNPSAFNGFSDPDCDTNFANDNAICGPTVAGTGGNVRIYWGPSVG